MKHYRRRVLNHSQLMDLKMLLTELCYVENRAKSAKYPLFFFNECQECFGQRHRALPPQQPLHKRLGIFPLRSPIALRHRQIDTEYHKNERGESKHNSVMTVVEISSFAGSFQ